MFHFKILHSKITKVCVAVLGAFLIMWPSTIALAAQTFDSNDLLSILGQTPFFCGGNNPGENSANPSSNSSGLSSGNVFILGDSITDRAQSTYVSSFQAKGITATVDASDGRSLENGGTNGNGLSGSAAIQADASQIKSASAVVVALGTNGGTDAGSIDKAISDIKAINSSAKLYWVDTIGVNGKNFGVAQTKTTNDAIYGEASKDGYTVISWFKVVDPNDDPQNPTNTSDPNGYIDNSDGLGVHPTPSGVTALVNAVVSAVTTGGTGNSSSSSNSQCCGGNTSSSNPSSSPNSSGQLNVDLGGGLTVTVYLPNDGQPHPLVIFAPGYQQNSSSSFYSGYLQKIAAAGFVVGGINFRNNSNGSNTALVPGEIQDIGTVVQQLPTNSQLSGKITSGDIGLVGHSDGAVDVLGAVYGPNPVKGINAVIAEDGSVPPGGLVSSGPPLLLMHGTADAIQSIGGGSDAVYSAVNATYKGYAKFNGADHYSYITGNPDVNNGPSGDFSSFVPASGAMTSAFLKRFLDGDSSSSPQAVAQQYASQISFVQAGNDAPTGSGGNSNSNSNSSQCCGSNTGGGGPTSLTGGSNAQQGFNFFVSKGLSPTQAAGILGNFADESDGGTDISPTITNPNSGAHGIAQWLGARLTAEQQFAAGENQPPDSLVAQLDFSWHEFTTNFSSVLQQIQASSDISQITTIVNNQYEINGISASAIAHRTSNAQNFLNQFGSGAGGGTGGTTTGSSNCKSTSSGNCINPFPGGWQPSRLDMGYDGTFKGQIVAPCSGTITYAANSFSNWGGYMEIKLDNKPAPLPTSTLYFSEGITPIVQAGQHVNAGDPIANPVPSVWNGINGNIEWGVAKDGDGVTDPWAEAGAPDPKSMVLAFTQWAESLGVAPPSSTDQAGYP